MDRRRILDQKRHPFYKENQAAFFIAYQAGKAVGRIAAIFSPEHCRRSGEQCGMFGFLEAIDDTAVFSELMEAAEEWLSQFQCKRIIGPINPSTNYELGFLIDGFDSPPFLMLSYNPPYYDGQMQKLGLQKVRDFYAWYIDKQRLQVPDKLIRIRKRVVSRLPVTIRSGNMKHFDQELKILQDIYNDAWQDHWGFLPMSDAEFAHLGQDLRLIIDPELVLIAEYEQEPIGFLLALPNFNEVLIHIRNGRLLPTGLWHILKRRRKIRGVRVITLGVKRQFQQSGLGSLFYEEIARRIITQEYDHAEMSWVMEDNGPMNSAARLLGGKKYKTYRLYEREI